MSHAGDTEVRALVLSRVSYGEADWIVHLFTDQFGRIAALARGARKSQKRFGGALEPLHTLRLRLTDKPRAELFTLKEGSLERPRIALTRRLELLDAAGRALGWVKRTAPPHTPEPEVWHALERLLDGLEGSPDKDPTTELVVFGMRLLDGLGWALDLNRCVSCGKPCPVERSAWVNPERGGLVCRGCGGGALLLPQELRALLLGIYQGRAPSELGAQANVALRLVERALRAHSGVEERGSSRRPPG